MRLLSDLALILLCLVGYSSGSVLASRGKKLTLAVGDLAVIVIMWSLALATRHHFGRWLAVVVWLIAGGFIGVVAVSLRHSRLAPQAKKEAQIVPPQETSLLQHILKAWTSFSHEMGNYQGRIMLAFFYFLIVSPFGLLTRLLGDPLRMRRSRQASSWIQRSEADRDLTSARRQF